MHHEIRCRLKRLNVRLIVNLYICIYRHLQVKPTAIHYMCSFIVKYSKGNTCLYVLIHVLYVSVLMSLLWMTGRHQELRPPRLRRFWRCPHTTATTLVSCTGLRAGDATGVRYPCNVHAVKLRAGVQRRPMFMRVRDYKPLPKSEDDDARSRVEATPSICRNSEAALEKVFELWRGDPRGNGAGAACCMR